MNVRSDYGVKARVQGSLLVFCVAAGIVVSPAFAADRPNTSPPATTQPAVDSEIAEAIQVSIGRARECLLEKLAMIQKDHSGNFSAMGGWSIQTSGPALVLWAVSASGADYAKQPAMQAGYDWLADHKYEDVVAVSQQVLALSAIKDRPPKLQTSLEANTRWLLDAASQEGYYYGTSKGGKHLRWNENYVSDWATMALAAADSQGAHIPQSVWLRMLKVWWISRAPAGGWSYFVAPDPSDQLTPDFNMTAAGISSMKTCLDHLDKATLSTPEVRAMAQGLEQQIAWLDAHAQLRTTPAGYRSINAKFQHPGTVSNDVFVPWDGVTLRGIVSPIGPISTGGVGHTELTEYWLLELGRLRQVTGKKKWGQVDAYPVLAMQLLFFQNNGKPWQPTSDGGWLGSPPSSNTLSTAYYLLFLLSDAPQGASVTQPAATATKPAKK